MKLLKMEKPRVTLIGVDGNAFAIMGACRKAAKKAGWSKDKIDDLINEMMSGDYDYLLKTAGQYFEID